jgi:hypothetical protein
MGVFQLTAHPVTAEFNGPTEPESHSAARVARMILRSLGASPPDPQAILDYIANHNYNDPGETAPFWDIDPGAMQHTLVDFDPLAFPFPGRWRIYTNTNQTQANAQIRSTLDNYQVAPAALTNQGKHWVVVVGYVFDDATNALTDFIIDDPAYEGGGANLPVSLAMWNAAYTPVGGGVKWLNKIVEVGDPNPAKEVPPEAQRRIQRPGDTIIPPDEAAELAVEGARYRYAELPSLRRALAEGRVGRPQLVAQLDSRGSYYYLVPVGAEADTEAQGRALAVIMVDARFGDVLSASASDEPYALWPVGREQALELVTRRPIPVYESVRDAAERLVDAISAGRLDPATTGLAYGAGLRQTVTAAIGSFANPRDHLVFRAGELEVARTMVWHPCGSASPFHPYLVVRSAWHNVYVNAHSGALRLDFDLCPWGRLGA